MVFYHQIHSDKHFKPKESKHILADFNFYALCKYSRNDDVLFISRDQDFNQKFAVIHLTWKGAKEVYGFPFYTFYDSFDDFKLHRMYPDKIEWEY